MSSSATICTSNITSGFIDLATYDELEKYMYGCGDAVAYFVRTTCKSTWFTQVPVVLSKASGQAAFNQQWSVSISRAGDYLLQTWLRVKLPQVQFASGKQGRWTRNLMHNLIKECCITFNDLVAARFDNHHLDFWTAFTVPASKQDGYNRMIGNTLALTDTTAANGFLPAQLTNANGGAGTALTSAQPTETFLNLPLPFFYSRDSGVALPTAALPYNEMKIQFSFRDWTELLITEADTTTAPANSIMTACATTADLQGGTAPVLTANVWANYAIVSNDERKRMACAPRDILIEQAQMANRVTWAPAATPNPSIDLRLSHAIKVLFFAVSNITTTCERSTYTVGGPEIGRIGTVPTKFTGQFQVDPLSQVSLVYENTNRLGQMGADFFSLVNPYYTAPVIPEVKGYHAYSYSLDFICLDPMGSTNYGKLTNVSIVPEATALAIAANGANSTGSATTLPLNNGTSSATVNNTNVNRQQKYEFVLTCVNNNIIRISGGALGFPVL
jgi:hypothetical protein